MFTRNPLETLIKREWKSDAYFTHGTVNAGACVLIHPQLNHIVKQVQIDNKGRTVTILLVIDDHILNLVYIYAPNNASEQGTFLAVIGMNVILLGREKIRVTIPLRGLALISS